MEILIGTFPSYLMALGRWVALCPQAVLNLQNNKLILLLCIVTEKSYGGVFETKAWKEIEESCAVG